MKKQEKGITLVDLIITIVVLLILAAVAIGAAKDSDIIEYAQNASSMYGTEKNEENQMLQNYIEIIENSTNTTDNIPIILGKYISGEIDEELFIEQMKKELSIDNSIESFAELCTGINNFPGAIYVYKVDKIYALELDENGEPNGNIIYLEKEKYKEQYRFGRTMKKIVEELERIFVGKTTSEILKLYEDEEFNDWIINNSEYIVNINTRKTNMNDMIVESVNWKENEYEISISKYDDNFPKTIWIYHDNEVYYKVYMEDGG